MAKTRLTAEASPRQFKAVAAVIEPIIAWCELQYGRKAELLTELNKEIAPQEVSRAQFDNWLHADADVRVQPSLGIGLCIQAVATKLGIYKEAKTKPTTTP